MGHGEPSYLAAKAAAEWIPAEAGTHSDQTTQTQRPAFSTPYSACDWV